MNKHKGKSIVDLLIFVVLISSSCSAPTIPIPATATSMPQTSTPSPTLTSTPTATKDPPMLTIGTILIPFEYTSTITPPPKTYAIKDLPPDDYILYYFPSGGNLDDTLYSVMAVSIDGSKKYLIETGILNACCFTLSPDYQDILSVDYTTSTRKIRISSLLDQYPSALIPSSDCIMPSWSPDGKDFASVCDGQIHVFKDRSQDMFLTEWSYSIDENRRFYYPIWSPDGSKIAFIRSYPQPSINPSNGLYITDISCIQDISTCKEKTHGPIGRPTAPIYGPIAWSPDGKFIAAINLNDELLLIDMQTGKINTLLRHNDVWGLIWSPDSKNIAFANSDSEIYTLQTQSGKINLVISLGAGNVIAWISIPSK